MNRRWCRRKQTAVFVASRPNVAFGDRGKDIGAVGQREVRPQRGVRYSTALNVFTRHIVPTTVVTPATVSVPLRVTVESSFQAVHVEFLTSALFVRWFRFPARRRRSQTAPAPGWSSRRFPGVGRLQLAMLS